MPSSTTYLNQTPIFEWFVVGCDSKNRYQKDNVLKRDLVVHSKRDNHNNLNNQHNWGDLINPFSRHQNISL